MFHLFGIRVPWLKEKYTRKSSVYVINWGPYAFGYSLLHLTSTYQRLTLKAVQNMEAGHMHINNPLAFYMLRG